MPATLARLSTIFPACSRATPVRYRKVLGGIIRDYYREAA
jgi:hypothetical protein